MTEFKYVPAVPTEAMLKAAADVPGDYWNDSDITKNIYTAMISAAPAHDGEVVYQIKSVSATGRWLDCSESQYSVNSDKNRRVLYTAPPRVVIDEAMIDRACKALFIKTTKYGRDGMKDALEAALEQSK